MANILLKKIALLFIGSNRRYWRLIIFAALAILFGILFLIRIVWKPIEYLIILILLLWMYVFYKRCIKNTIDKQLRDVEDLIELGKYEKALNKIDKIISEELNKLEEHKRRSVYCECLCHKAFIMNNCLNVENCEKAISLYEEVAGIYMEIHCPIIDIMWKEGLAYLNLGYITGNAEKIKCAIRIFERAWEDDGKAEGRYNGAIKSVLISCYEELALYEDEEKNLQAALENALDALDQAYKDKFNGNINYLKYLKACISLKLKKENKEEIFAEIHRYIDELCRKYNKYDRKFFPRIYINNNLSLAQAYMYMTKDSKNNEEYREKYNQCINRAKEYCREHNDEKYSNVEIYLRRIDRLEKQINYL